MRWFFALIALLSTTCAFGEVTGEPSEPKNASVVEGTLLQVSALPPAAESAYADCYFTATLEGEHVVSGQPMPKKVVLVLPGFFSRQYAPEAKLKAGDTIRATVVPFASMPDAFKQVQQADDIESVDLEIYFPQKVVKIQKFESLQSAVPFSTGKAAIADRIEAGTVDANAKVVRQATIKRDIEKINQLLAEHGGDWDKWYESLKDLRLRYAKSFSEQSQKWIGDSFFSAGFVDNDRTYGDDFIKSAIAFKEYLAARNVDLILVRVPWKGEVSDDMFVSLPPDQVHNPYLLRMYKELLEADVEIITDIVPQAKASRLKFPLMFWYQDFRETHPAEGMSWVIAEEVAKRLTRYERVQKRQKENFLLREIAQPYEDYRWPEGNTKFNPKEYVRFSAVTAADGKPLQLKQGGDSPVLVAGSSFISRPALNKGGSIPHYLAYLSKVAPDILFRNGSDASVPRSIAREGDSFLKGRSVVIFPFQPFIAYKPLSLPPIANPLGETKVLLESYTGEKLRKNIQLLSGTNHGLSFSSEGSLVAKPVRRDDRKVGSLSLTLPADVSRFSMFSIELDFSTSDKATIMAEYAGQKDAIYRSNTQPNMDDFLVFKADKATEVRLEFVDQGSFNEQAVVHTVKIHGIRQK